MTAYLGPAAALGGPPPGTGRRHLSVVNGPASPEPVTPGVTDPRRRVPCKGGCGTLVRPSNKTGLCRSCWLAAKDAGDWRKREPEEHAAMMFRVLHSMARRAVRTDPGRGLASLLMLEDLVRELVRSTGVEVTRQIGQQAVAEDLELSTGQRWHRMRVHKRWGRFVHKEGQ